MSEATSEPATNNFTKDPDSDLDYGIDWAPIDTFEGPWLVDGDTIASSSWIVTPADGQLDPHGDDHTDTTTVVWLTGGVLGQKYAVTNRIVTVQGRTEDQTLNIKIVEH